MDINIIRLLFDAGLVVLIWMIQLVVYPSFLFYKKKDLVEWHKKYTISISYIVIPLMLGQLVLGLQQTIVSFNLFTIIYFLLVLCNWGITFFIFVPLHGKISSGIYKDFLLNKLVSYNWARTTIWTIILTLSIYEISVV